MHFQQLWLQISENRYYRIQLSGYSCIFPVNTMCEKNNLQLNFTKNYTLLQVHFVSRAIL